MSVSSMERSALVVALALASALGSGGCGEDSEKEPDAGEQQGGTSNEGGMEEVPKVRTASGTLVIVTATDTTAPITIPHKIVVLDAFTDEPLGPQYQTMTSPSNGFWEIKDIPTSKTTSLHIQGQGDAATGYYDSVITNVMGTTADDALTRISSAGTAATAGIVAGFTPKQDMAALTVGVYQVRNRTRIGVVGCTQVWLDDDPNQPPALGDLRYVAANGLPTTIANQNKTEASRGALLFGNIAKGRHKMKLSVDGGKTFFGETEFYIGKSRDDATSASKNILYQIGIELPDDKTPSDCK
jgi:hypothetical protein